MCSTVLGKYFCGDNSPRVETGVMDRENYG